MSKNKLGETPLAATIAKGQMSDPAQPSDLATGSAQSVSGSTQTLRDGSTLYYATLRMDEQDRLQAINALGLIKTLSSCLTGVQEPNVAQTKLQWWSDEINRLALNEPRHPTTKRCANALAGKESVQAHLTTLLDTATAARFDAPDDDEGWYELIQRDYAARLSVVQLSLGLNNHSLNKDFATAVGWVDILTTLPGRIHHDTIALPPSLLKDFNLTTEDLRKQLRIEGRKNSTPQNASVVQSLLQEAVNRASTTVRSALQSPAYEQLKGDKNQRALAIWLQIRYAQLTLWQKAQPDLLRETMTLTPLKKWYIAFQHRK